MDSVKESLTQAIKERFTSPLWGYIILSWCGFNWKNFAILFASKETIEKRLEIITSQEYFYTHHLITPVIIGCILAAISPYLKWLLSKAHEFGESMLINVDKKRITDNYQKEIDTTNKRIERDFAARIAEADKQKELVKIEEEQKQLPFKTAAMKKEHEQMSASLEMLKNQIEQQISSGETQLTSQRSKLSEVKKNHDELLYKTKRLLDTFDKYHELLDPTTAKNFNKEIRGIFSDIELAKASIRSLALTKATDSNETESDEILDNIKKTAETYSTLPSIIQSEQLKNAFDKFSQFHSPNNELQKLSQYAQVAFFSPDKEKFEKLSRHLKTFNINNEVSSKLAAETVEILSRFDDKKIKQMEEVAVRLKSNSPEMVNILEAIRLSKPLEVIDKKM
ncbi:hypothetical protein LF942_19940 [Pectobacterium brasiliense]|nr:hypothetical protein [Pectobacterium brasiliense]